MFWPAAFFLGESIKVIDTYSRGHYFGHGKGDDSYSSVPINSLDRAAMRHDYAYSISDPGRSGRVQKAGADLDMAGETFLSSPLVGAAMAGQFALRVLTFNQFDLPWAD